MEYDKIPVSVVILTYNEENNIENCLKTIAEWADEILIVDSGSSDRTLEIARKYTNNIYYHKFENYSLQRNWAQKNLSFKHDWVFHIDADERVTPELVEMLKNFFKDNNLKDRIAGILIRRKIEFLGKYIKHGGIYPTYHCRIFKRSCGWAENRYYDQHFHVDGPTIKLDADIIEISARPLFKWIEKHNRWAQKEAMYLLKKKLGLIEESEKIIKPRINGTPIERRRWQKSKYEKAPLFVRSLLYFCWRYLIRLGFLDGIEGLIYHFLHAFWFRFYIDACYYEIKKSLK